MNLRQTLNVGPLMIASKMTVTVTQMMNYRKKAAMLIFYLIQKGIQDMLDLLHIEYGGQSIKKIVSGNLFIINENSKQKCFKEKLRQLITPRMYLLLRTLKEERGIGEREREPVKPLKLVAFQLKRANPCQCLHTTLTPPPS